MAGLFRRCGRALLGASAGCAAVGFAQYAIAGGRLGTVGRCCMHHLDHEDGHHHSDMPSHPSEVGRHTCPRCKRRRRVAVYGGAFDPVTNGHLSCAAEIVHSGLADEVLMVPCGPRPDKPKMKTKAADRYVMLQIAVNTSFSPNFPVKVSDIEVFGDRALPTYDMLSLLREKNPGIDFMFVVGSDWLQSGSDLRQWTSKDGRTGEKLVSEFDFLIIKRPGYELPTDIDKYGPRFNVLSLPHGMNYVDSNVSSTEIRKRVAVSEQIREFAAGNHLSSADGLVPTGVLAYIQRQGLYKKDRDCTAMTYPIRGHD